LRIFISSTAVDLHDYREKVRDVVLRMEGLPIGMETFSALGGEPVQECMKMAAEADAVICIVAHRYGYVPPTELGGDGERSITWLEVDAAGSSGKPVFTFLVDPKAPWTEVREQDRLTSEPREKAPEIVKAVQDLQKFKAYLETYTTRRSFTDVNDLAAEVAAALANFAPRKSEHTARVWQPLFCHALQPAKHFRGREANLRELKDWLQAPGTPARVISVVAAGGTGKTALVDKALREATPSERAGTFIWSFYEDAHTDAFLRAAYIYFTGENVAPASGMLERLQIALSGDRPHVLILDGLERVQSEGDSRRRGELDDMQLKRLLRALAGGGGSTRALVTSRFSLPDLDEFAGAGYCSIALDDLELPAALDMLRDWKIKGTDAELEQLIEPLNVGGMYHALSVEILGSYFGNFDGPAPAFSFEDATNSDPKARRLSRILEQYAKILDPSERDLLARLSIFPSGVKTDLLGWIVQSGGDVAGALIGLEHRQLVQLLERLNELGLVFRYEKDGQAVYSAHPFLREFFRNLLGTKPESVHESVRRKLARTVKVWRWSMPKDALELDQCELLIEETRLAGKVKRAFLLYCFVLGAYINLVKRIGENSRGLRILAGFAPKDEFSKIDSKLPSIAQGVIINDIGMYAERLGDLARARLAFRHLRKLAVSTSRFGSLAIASGPTATESQSFMNIAEVELLAGNFQKALDYSKSAVSLAAQAKDRTRTMFSLSFRASSSFALGDVSAAAADFQKATELEGKPLYSLRGIYEAESKFARGDRQGAIKQSQANWETLTKMKKYANENRCRCDALLARLLLPDDSAYAAKHLDKARAFAEASGVVELQLRCFHSACELYQHLGDYLQAIAEGEAGVLLADTCGFGKYSIDIRIALAETYVAVGDARKALQNARNALDRSEHPDCQYAWGKADGLHFCGLAHMRLGDRELARQRLTSALELRDNLGHGRLEDTRKAMEDLAH
jgi:tetratricopeptide (TPR) repeat protein